jgi:hypothetical protein
MEQQLFFALQLLPPPPRFCHGYDNRGKNGDAKTCGVLGGFDE